MRRLRTLLNLGILLSFLLGSVYGNASGFTSGILATAATPAANHPTTAARDSQDEDNIVLRKAQNNIIFLPLIAGKASEQDNTFEIIPGALRSKSFDQGSVTLFAAAGGASQPVILQYAPEPAEFSEALRVFNLDASTAWDFPLSARVQHPEDTATDQLGLFHYEPGNSAWVQIPAQIDPAAKAIVGLIQQTGRYALLYNVPCGQANSQGDSFICLEDAAGQPAAQTSIRFLRTHIDPVGNGLVQVEITGWTVASAVITGGTPGKVAIPLARTPAYGADVWTAIFSEIPNNEAIAFTISAKNIDGSTTQLEGKLRGWNNNHQGVECILSACGGWVPAAGHGVLTARGNLFYRLPLLSLPGPGDSDMELVLTYHSQGQEDGLAGRGWFFTYGMHLQMVDTPLLRGAEIRYPDGRLVRFANIGEGVFEPVDPDIHDRLENTGAGYRLTRTKALQAYLFDAAGKLSGLQDRNQNAVRLIYEGDRLVRIENDAQRSADVTLDDQGRITSIAATGGSQVSLRYQGDQLSEVTDLNGGVWKFTYSILSMPGLVGPDGQAYTAVDNLLTVWTDPRGLAQGQQSYDSLGRVREQTFGGSERYTFSYYAEGRATAVTDAYGNKTTYFFDSLSRLVEQIAPDSRSELFYYDADFNRNYYMDGAGRVWRWLYDTSGNLLREEGPLGWLRTWEYNPLGLPVKATEKLDETVARETLFTYNAAGNLRTITNPLGAVADYRYDERGLLTRAQDFAGRLIYYIYNNKGDLTSRSNGTETYLYQRDEAGRFTQVTLPEGQVYAYTYTPANLIHTVSGPLGFALNYIYDPAGNLVSEVDPTGAQTRYEVDAAGRVTAEVDPLDSKTEYIYGQMGELVRKTDAEGRVWEYGYDRLLRLVQISGPLGATTRYEYDLADNRTAVIDAEGRVQHTEFDALNRPTAVTENYKPLEQSSSDTNLTTRYTYDQGGRLLQTVDPEGNPTTYTYDLLDRVTGFTSAENQQWTFAYDAAGSLERATSPLGAVTVYGYDAANRLIRETDAYGQVTRYEYNRNGWQTAAIDPLGVVTAYQYDALGRPVAEIHNALTGQPASVKDNVTTAYEYDLAGKLQGVTDPRGSRAKYAYDAAGRLVEAVDFSGAATRYTYDRIGNLLTVTDPLNAVTRYTVDVLDRRVAITNPEEHTIQYAYNKVGALVSITDANGGVTTFTLDGVERVQKQTDALGGSWSFAYNRAGRITAETDPNGSTRSYAYDRVYRPLTYTAADGGVTQYGWDADSNLVSLVDPLGRTTGYEYDLLNRLTAFTLPSGAAERYTYDPLGNRTATTDADGISTRYEYDPLYRLIAVTQNSVDDAPTTADVNVATRYSYDASGGLVEITNPLGAVTRFERDAMGRPVKEINPLGSAWTYTWDSAGNLASRLDANGALTEYAYYTDAMLRQVSYADGKTLTFTYDPNNNRTSMTDALGESRWEYDALNRIIRAEDPLGRRIKLGYDAAGNRTSLTYPNNYQVRWQYDTENRMTAMIDPAGRETIYNRDAAGSITGIVYPNGIDTRISFTADVQIASIMHRRGVDGPVTAGVEYAYSPAGDVTQTTNHYGWRQPAEVTERYQYDPLHRLTGIESSEGITTTYQYDAAGNRLLWQSSDNPFTGAPADPFQAVSAYNAANLLTQTQITGTLASSGSVNGTVSYQYDANGNRIDQRVQGSVGPVLGIQYAYDAENRLASAQAYQVVDHSSTAKRGLTTYAYDGLGRLIVQEFNPQNGSSRTRTETLYDGLDPIAEYMPRSCRWSYLYRGAENALVSMQRFPASSTNTLEETLGLREEEMASSCGVEQSLEQSFTGDKPSRGNTYWFLLNARSDVIGLIKADGQSVHNYRYDPFGGLYPDDGIFTSPHNRFTFSGKRLDENTGLMYFGARHYDSLNGVWLTQDLWRGEISDPVSLHRTLFANANPFTLRDAYGFQPEMIQQSGAEQYDTLRQDPLARQFSDTGDMNGVFIQDHFFSAAGGSYAVPEYNLEGTGLYFDLDPNEGTGLSTTGRLFGRYETYGIQPIVDGKLSAQVSTQQEVYRLGFVEPGMVGYRDTAIPALRLPASVVIGRNGLLLAFDAFNRYGGEMAETVNAGKQVLEKSAGNAAAFTGCPSGSVGVPWSCAFANQNLLQAAAMPGPTSGTACTLDGNTGQCLSGTLDGRSLSMEVFAEVYGTRDTCPIRRPQPRLPWN